NALMNLSRAYQGQPPPARDPDSPGLPPPTRELVTRSVKQGMGIGGKKQFPHDFEVTAVSPLSVRFCRHPDAAPAPHDASGTLTMVGAEHNTTQLSMAAQMAAAGEGSPSSTNVLSAKEAHVLLDDLLLLLPALFAMFDRSAEVDEAVLAYLWYYESYERKNLKNANPIMLGFDIPNSHSMFQLLEVNIGAGQKRFYACKWTWSLEPDGAFFVAVTSVQDLPEGEEKAAILDTVGKNKSSDAVILSQSRAFYRISSLAENVCRVTLVGQGVIGGWVPDQAMKFLIKFFLSIVEDMRD
ncbi:hypothetical protein TeGR_g5105, partial [Tetraparma gracilis]